MFDFYTIEKTNKAQVANNDFSLLCQFGLIGFYQSVEVVQVFLLEKKSIVKNLYTLFTFSELEYEESMFNYLTEKLFSINNNYSIGVIKGTINIQEASKCFSDIQNGQLILNNDNCFISKKMFLLPKTFIPKTNMRNNPMLNKIIKPNYWGDNYIIEFFDEEKDFFNHDIKSREYIDAICNFITGVKDINIDLSKVRDRIGNIIFQFPITIYKFNINSNKDFISIQIQGEAHPLLTSAKTLSINIKTSNDDVITGNTLFESNSLSFMNNCQIGDDSNLEISVIDKSKNILLHNAVYILTKHISCSMNIGFQYGPQRIIKDRNGTIISKIDIFNNTVFGVGRNNKKSYESYIRKRHDNNDIIQHSDDYLVLLKEERNKALEFISNKFRKHEIKEICLWDPYLSAKDIIDVLYTENTGIPFRCITSYQNSKKVRDGDLLDNVEAIQSYEEYKSIQINDFLTLSNNLNVTLKFVTQHDSYGWQFHDRFLILIPKDETQLPDVYSLGTSINIIGKTHHIIQKVTNPNIILHNFEVLWKELDNPDCIIIEFDKGIQK